MLLMCTQTDQWNRTKSPEIDSGKYRHLLMTELVRQIKTEKDEQGIKKKMRIRLYILACMQNLTQVKNKIILSLENGTKEDIRDSRMKK